MSLTARGESAIAEELYRYERTYTPLSDPSKLDDEAIRLFHEQGFIAIENVFTLEEALTAKAAVRDLIIEGDPKIVHFEKAGEDKSLSPEEREQYVRKVYRFVGRDERLTVFAKQSNLIGIVEKLVRSQVRMLQDMALLKPAHVGREKPWHQDMAYFIVSPPEKVIGTWTALDAATAENGCMHVIPGSHKQGPQPHYHDRDCQLPDEEVAVDKDVMVPLKPGGVLFFSALLHHGTPPNRSTTSRKAIQLHYCSVDCVPIGAEEHHALYADAQNRYAGCATYRHGREGMKIEEWKRKEF